MASDDRISVVEDFCAAWSGPEMDRIESLLAPDVFYANGPLPPLQGRMAVMDYLRSAGPFEAVRWDVLNIARSADTVLTERVDYVTMAGRTIALPIMGAFEVEQGLISGWRDYFDLTSYRAHQNTVK